MRRYLAAIILAGAALVKAQDSLAVPPPNSARSISSGPLASSFYDPPALSDLWARFYERVDGMSDEALTRRFVQGLLDSLTETMQAEIDTLMVRARAFESSEQGYAHRFYRSPLTREQVLGDPISEVEAADVPHFHAVYDPQGYLLRVRYVEPRRWRARQQLLATRSFQTVAETPPLVRYFEAWDVRRLAPLAYTRKKKIPEGEAYIRVLYDPQDNIKSLQKYDQTGTLIYTLAYRHASADSSLYGRLEFAADSIGSLLDVHPYVYLRDWSLVKPGWKVALTRDAEGLLTSTQVFNEHDQLSYYYTFSLSRNPEKRTSTLRSTVLSDSSRTKRVFALVYDHQDHMVRRSFYTEQGQLTETTTYDYHRRSARLVVTTRNAAGKLLSQRRVVDPRFWN